MLDTLQFSFILLLFFVVQGVSAGMAAIDVIALIIGIVIIIFGICAGIGFYAHKKQGN